MDAERPGDSITLELLEKKCCGDGCSKKFRDHRSCKERVRSSVNEISSVKGVVQKAKGEVNEVRATPG